MAVYLSRHASLHTEHCSLHSCDRVPSQVNVQTSSLAFLALHIAALHPSTPLVLIGGTNQLPSGVIL
jgi:hypothetical protein